MISNLDCVDLNADFFVYNLSCPITDKVKYIGITNNPKQRYSKHLITNKATLKNNWIKSLRSKGVKPIMTIIDFASNRDEINSKEKYWIIKHNEWGCDLKNMTDGGDGGNTFSGRSHTDESKRKISIANSNTKRPDLGLYSKQTKSKKVAQICFDTKSILNVYNSVSDASRLTGCSKTNISKFANGSIKKSIKKVGGYEWRYID